MDEGDIVRIDLGDGRHVFGLVLSDPYVAVVDLLTEQDDVPNPNDVLARPVLFIVAVYHHEMRSWPVVGRVADPGALPAVPEQFTQNIFQPQDIQIIDVYGNMRPATPQECVGLEAAAVWEVFRVVERIQDHYAGRPNPQAEFFKVKL